MRIERHDLDGTGARRTCVYDMPATSEPLYAADVRTVIGQVPTYWPAVTDVPCPCDCIGRIRWAEAGYVPGYRICDECGRHFQAGGTAAAPTLMRVRQRRSDLTAAARHRKADPHCTCPSCIAFHAATVRP